jgi:sec-independent protein translocase protein TatA
MSFGIKELIVILIIVMLVFGTKKIRGVGADVGSWIRDFKKAMKEGEDDALAETAEPEAARVIEGEATPAGEKERV